MIFTSWIRDFYKITEIYPLEKTESILIHTRASFKVNIEGVWPPALRGQPTSST